MCKVMHYQINAIKLCYECLYVDEINFHFIGIAQRKVQQFQRCMYQLLNIHKKLVPTIILIRIN